MRRKSDNSLVEINLLYSYMFENKVEHFDGESLQSDYLQHVIFAIEEYKNSLCKSSRTSKLWIQYPYHISLGKDVIHTERTTDWKRHLVTAKCMLNLLATAGRLNYAKSARLYLQSLDGLPEQHPWLHQCFQEKGYHAVRRNERYWTDLWLGLVIEQVLIRSFKRHDGLRRGRDMDENIINIWIQSTRCLAGIHYAMSSLTGQIHETSEQHVKRRESHIKRDLMNLATLKDRFEDHSPFTYLTELISIANGVTDSEESQVKCDEAEQIGANIQQSLDNVEIKINKIKRSEKVQTMATLQNAVKIEHEEVPIDPMTLFSCLVVLVMRENDIPLYYFYMLLQYPTSLFENGIMRDPKKSKFENI